MSQFSKNLSLVQDTITQSELHYHRKPGSVRLLAVSKGQALAKIKQALIAGQQCFGENYLQEALLKITALADQAIEWHFIGPIQSNKTKKISQYFHWVQSISDLNIAKRLNDQRPSTLPPLNICLQVNLSHEASKSGISSENVFALATECAKLPHLRLRGLMAIPAISHDLTEQRTSFRQLYQIYKTLCAQGFALDTLSMGMSEDMVAAIAEGATMVRIGTALFGDRS